MYKLKMIQRGDSWMNEYDKEKEDRGRQRGGEKEIEIEMKRQREKWVSSKGIASLK